MSLLMAGHHIDCMAHRRYLVIPLCPECILFNISDLIDCGITKRLSLSSRPFEIDNSSLTGRKGFSGPIDVTILLNSEILIDCRQYCIFSHLNFL